MGQAIARNFDPVCSVGVSVMAAVAPGLQLVRTFLMLSVCG
jgi:hypothetical protein